MNSPELMAIMMMNTLGLSILYREFKQASWYYFHPKKEHSKTASSAIVFIQGTGLEMLLMNYGLLYNADNLRNVFFSMVGDHAKII